VEVGAFPWKRSTLSASSPFKGGGGGQGDGFKENVLELKYDNVGLIADFPINIHNHPVS
jgi:hypothetical protein